MSKMEASIKDTPKDLIPTKKEAYIPLELVKDLFFSIGRIGYDDEGIRLTFLDNVPCKLHFEVQFSKRDTEKLIEQLTLALEEETKRGLK